MYPLVVLLGVYLFYQPIWYRLFLMAISMAGGVTAAIHAALVWFDPTQGCGAALPCTMEYGLYIGSLGIQPVVLPLLALTAFVFILASLLVHSSDE
jgi:disulfide bond formation protein DsbB